ncbi:MAG: AIPR family protein [Actinomycetota bacterium]|nr:AIPR family protein [Actinomycetota bacterium]
MSDELPVTVDGWFEEVGTGWTAICASVPALWLTELYDRYGDKLYSANVRGYMPSRRTAKNINYNMEQTARQRPGYFWAFNNGTTALVNDYSAPKSHGPHAKLILRGVAIVNGAQTTGALSRSKGTIFAMHL